MNLPKKLFFSLLVSALWFLVLTQNTLAALSPTEISTNPDINIALRKDYDPQPAANNLQNVNGLIDIGGDTDPKAPQLNTISANPTIKSKRQVGGYENGSPTLKAIPADNSNNWGVTLSGLTNSGDIIKVPQSGYNIGEGYQVVILYATNNQITISYTNGGDSIVRGYTIHILNFSVDQDLVIMYQQNIGQGKVVELPCGYPLGTSIGSELVSIRDTGSFMDPRSRKDWWQSSPQTLECDSSLKPKVITIGQSSGLAKDKASLTISGNPIPQPHVPGFQTREDEFHALRPYQASPYGMLFGRYVEEAHLFCGNDIVVKQTYNLTPADATSCDEADASGKKKCYFDPRSGSAKIEIDLEDSELPIVNNTTLVPNRINKANELDDETRMNEYLTWYLGGTVFKAYENPIEDTAASIEKLINFSGPLNKLLPDYILELQRALTVEVIDLRHNQIYECLVDKNPVACAGSLDAIAQKARLTPDGDNRVGGTPPFTRSPYIPLAPTEDRAGSVVVPEPQFLNEETRLTQPNIDGIVVDSKSIAFDPDPGITDLVKLGPVDGKEVNSSFKDKTEEPHKYTPARDDLYFSGIAETTELAKLLQQTYRPANLLPEKAGWDGDTGAGPYFRTGIGCEFADAKTGPGDDLFGDYHSKDNGYNTNIKGTLSYNTLPFEVTFEPSKTIKKTAADIDACKLNCGSNIECQVQCSATSTVATYEKKVNVYAAMAVYVRSPKLRELTARLISGGSGVVQRIFPINILKDVVYNKDYAAYTKATYKLAGDNETEDVEVLAGDAQSNVPGSQAKLYFPGLGAVQEYFLRGIQCALRPQGFCEPSSVFLLGSGDQTTTTAGACQINCTQSVPDSAIPSQYLGQIKSNFINAAKIWHKPDGTGQDGYNSGKGYAEECYNDVVKRSLDRGVYPGFSLLFWLNESAASNYTSRNTSCETQDFGINITSIAADFDKQITQFLQLPTASGYKACMSTASSQPWDSPTQGFLYRYRNCGEDPSKPWYKACQEVTGCTLKNEAGEAYYNAVKPVWWFFMPNSCPFPNSPTAPFCT